jgi:pimeloyl-ACP methyl ester carboxylesterase
VPEQPPVLLVHGFASSFERGWRRPGWVDLLEDMGRTVVGVDLLGHGDAPKPHDPSAYADVAGRVLDAAPPVVDAVGFSLGAVVLLEAASRAPERFRRLAIMGIGGGLFREREADDPLRQAFARFVTSDGNDPEALAAFRQRPTEPIDFARITGPVLIVLGERDAGVPAEPLAEAMSNAEVTVRMLSGVDHFGTPTDFGAIDAVLSFLAE